MTRSLVAFPSSGTFATSRRLGKGARNSLFRSPFASWRREKIMPNPSLPILRSDLRVMQSATPQHERAPGFKSLKLVLQPNGMAVELTRPNMLLGRHSTADLRLPLPDVSRRHCRFLYQDGVWQVLDLRSMNGVYVNGKRVQQASLQDQDMVAIGGFQFKVVFRGEQRGDGPSADTCED